MTLPLAKPFTPMEAQLVDDIPIGPQWEYEPKWDGFRAIVFRDRTQVVLQSKAGKPLGRYFPELVGAVGQLPARRFVLDGEIVVPIGKRAEFDQLLMRIHPAASRVARLAHEHPALLIVFDLLVDTRGRSLLDKPLAERRELLETFAGKQLSGQERIRLSPATTAVRTARRWFHTAGNSLDGVVAKRVDLAYQSGERSGMVKIKPIRTADCVVGGFRYASRAKTVGSLLLGLYGDDGLLNHVGFVSAIKDQDRGPLTAKLKKLIEAPGFTGQAPGGPSRWSTERSSQWEPLRPKLVVEVAYDQFTAGRFRHGARLLRWRPDKPPRECTFDQVEQVGGGSLKLLK